MQKWLVSGRHGAPFRTTRFGFSLALLAGAAGAGCSADVEPSEANVGQVAEAHRRHHHHHHPKPPTPPPNAGCGYRLSSDIHDRSHHGYEASIKLTNVAGEAARDFEILLDTGDARIVRGSGADFEEVAGSYSATAPHSLRHNRIRRGESHKLHFKARGRYDGLHSYLISINGERCDTSNPSVDLVASDDFFTGPGTLTLTADAADDMSVSRVVFTDDGVVVGEDHEAPYVLDIDVTSALDGRHFYTATAYDPSGNTATSETVRVLVALDNKFLGTAPARAADYQDLLAYFDQITPGNAGKWGSVEATRDVMNWTDLDVAHDFAVEHGLRFKMHTLIWGQQQPAWISSLTPAEQLAEIEEWMAAVAERYPDLEMIDVVNEPLHAPPAYSEALGGAGATGWDWMIKSFELARHYFPRSELILNDYNILIMDQFTTDYLALIELLMERNLIDGVGEQAHFLERADVAVVAGNLDRLAATGLPVYISELDVNFADDARQANVMKDLFPLFWHHPSVVGVTHWGHLEGGMFQPDAYLIRGDHSVRPALDFMMCTVAGGSDCPVPVYVPAPRTGDLSGLTLEAEDFDEAQGILASGSIVAFTDNGDWQSFAKVNFQNNWDSFSVRYAKGNTDPASISVHLDSLANAPVLTVPLPSTGDWGTLSTVSVPFSPLVGQRDVYIRYNGGFGVANVDWFRVGAPTGLGPSVLANGYFESNANGWFSWDGTVSATNERAKSGSQSLKLSNRGGNGPAATSLTSAVTPGTTYRVSLWATIGGTTPANVNITQKIQCSGASESYSWLVAPKLVTPGEWVEFSGDLVVPNCTLADLLIFAEGPPGGVDLYLDHASVRGPGVVNLVANGTFESSTAGWFSWDGTLSTTTTRAHGGSRSLLVSNRAGNGPAATSLTGVVTAGRSYDVSFWVSIGNAAQANVNLTQAVACDGVQQFAWMANPVPVLDGQWVELRGRLNMPNCNVTGVNIYAEGPPGGVDLYVDDVAVYAPATQNLLSDGEFESSTGAWFSWDGALSTTTTIKHGGARSLRVSGRSGNGPAARNVTSLVTPGKTHQVSFWVSITGAASANVNTTTKLQCQGQDATFSWIAAPVAVNDSQWVQLSGPINVPNCALQEVLIYAEGPPGGVDLYVDDVVLAP
jgi:endo-1,4-beta-xylanase